ncbi:MAG TPA: acetate/propionate family kinase [Steroidobacteraceae bacterium]|jgi:acetate kinase|nr:acetate/propionate family kinase [Steroidobacteraceae bacterium]
MPQILTINAGSSSVRYALFSNGADPHRLLDGKIERLGGESAGAVAKRVVQELKAKSSVGAPDAVGHRVVHGLSHTQPELISESLIAELREVQSLDPEHLPREIEIIEAMQEEYPRAPHVACFDTAFHRSMPPVATMLPIPRRYFAKGVQRYGFHGLSYTFLLKELNRLGDPAAVKGRVVMAHLGSGASIAAVLDGKSIDTSMAFTPTAGLVMGTRSGDLDPGLMSYLARRESMSTAQFQTLVNHESGLKGISETSADVRDLLERETEDPRAREAMAIFCYQAKKWIGAFAAALGGLDTLVFAGGIGENSAVVRQRICEGLQHLGIEIDGSENHRHADRISSGRAVVRVIRTDEESVIAESTARLLSMQKEESRNGTS